MDGEPLVTICAAVSTRDQHLVESMHISEFIALFRGVRWPVETCLDL